MVTVALVEDTELDAVQTTRALEQYFQEASVDSVQIKRFSDAQTFLEATTQHEFDLIFLDIEMPGDDGLGMDGMQAAQIYRESNPSHAKTPIIFTTKVAQLAAKGYEVSAVGYLIKPFDYGTFALTMKRAMTQVQLNTRDVTITVTASDGTHFLSSQDVTHIEVRDHMVYIHLVDGTTQTMWGALKDFVTLLEPVHFILCNRYCLVNLQYVSGFNDKELLLGEPHNIHIEMSRGKKAAVVESLLKLKAQS